MLGLCLQSAHHGVPNRIGVTVVLGSQAPALARSLLPWPRPAHLRRLLYRRRPRISHAENHYAVVSRHGRRVALIVTFSRETKDVASLMPSPRLCEGAAMHRSPWELS